MEGYGSTCVADLKNDVQCQKLAQGVLQQEHSGHASGTVRPYRKLLQYEVAGLVVGRRFNSAHVHQRDYFKAGRAMSVIGARTLRRLADE